MSASSAARVKAPRRASRWSKLVTMGVASGLALAAAELLTRCASGYRLFTASLAHTGPPTTAIDAAFAAHTRLIEDFLAANAGPGLEPSWIHRTPPVVKAYEIKPATLARFRSYGFREFIYHLNEAWLRSHWIKGGGVDILPGVTTPPDFEVFTLPGGDPLPSYRFPPSVTLPTGLTTNAFGFRGREVALNKPARTVRIACVGASTTVCQHLFRHSYPELLEHWLTLWGQAQGLNLRFEVLNAGREAIRSSDIRAIVELEVLPLCVDYVVYYEGSNQFHLPDLAKHIRATEAVDSLVPPAELDIPQMGVAPQESWLDRSARWSALAERVRSVCYGSALLVEPDKPAQHIVWPEGLDPAAPTLESAAQFANMAAIFSDLDRIRSATESAGARLVLCSFAWLVHEGLELHPVTGRNIMAGLNRAFWPIRYGVLRRLVDLENRFFALWARRHSVDFIDVAAATPAEPALFNDQVHGTELGLRVRAWLVFRGLVRLIERDLQAGRIPVPPRQRLQRHPGIGIVRTITSRQLDGR